jgi:hypothetical protein
LLVPLDPTCEGCVNIQKVAQAYMLPESPWTTCLEIKYHDSPEYAITLCDDQKGIPQWGGYDIVLTLTTIAGSYISLPPRSTRQRNELGTIETHYLCRSREPLGPGNDQLR